MQKIRLKRFSLLFCAGFFLISYALYGPKEEVFSDAHAYNTLALNILFGQGYIKYPGAHFSNLIQAPLYPWFLAIIYRIFGYNHNVVYVIQAILYLMSCFLIFKIGKLVFNNKTVGRIGFLLFLFYFPALLFINRLWAEILAIFISCLFFFFYLWTEDKRRSSYYFFPGLTLGFLSLVKPSFLFFCLPLTLVEFLKKDKPRQPRKSLILISSFLIVITPWIIRNWVVTKSWVPISTAGSFNFWTGNFPPAGGTTRLVSPELYPQDVVEALRSPQDVTKINRILYKSALGYMFEDPLRTLKIFSWKFLRFWFEAGEDLAPHLFANLAYNSLNLMLLSFMLFGWLKGSILNNPCAWPLVLVIFYLLGVHMLTLSEPRYSLVIMPLVCLFAGYGIFKAIDERVPA